MKHRFARTSLNPLIVLNKLELTWRRFFEVRSERKREIVEKNRVSSPYIMPEKMCTLPVR